MLREGPLASGGVDALRLEELAHLRGRLRALGQPGADLVLVDADRRRGGLRVVLPDRLDEAAVARRALVGDHHAPDRVLAAAHAGEPQSYCHWFLSKRERRSRLAARCAAAPGGAVSAPGARGHGGRRGGAVSAPGA